MRQNIRWQAKTGQEIMIEISLVTERAIDLDGDKDMIPCCTIETKGYINGSIAGYAVTKLASPCGDVVASCGRIGLTADHYAAYLAMRAEIEASPEWQAEIAREKRAEKESIEYDVHYARVRRAMDTE